MTPRVNETHDPALRSWIDSANTTDHDFPIQNLPFGVRTIEEEPCVVVAIGEEILNLRGSANAALLEGCSLAVTDACTRESLNALMMCAPEERLALRRALQQLLGAEASRDVRERVSAHLSPQSSTPMTLPAAIGDYTDFFASIDHARRVGELFRPRHPLPPNYAHLPLAYHGRSSSIVTSGTTIQRPLGQRAAGEDGAPEYGPCGRLDYEVELGFFVGRGNARGVPVPVSAASEYLFGVCLLNDWSARDIQGLESNPLGPFLSKSFATTISPWVITAEALAPFRVAARPRGADEPEPLPYLSHVSDRDSGALAITVDAYLYTRQLRQSHASPFHVSRSSAASLYWTPAQMIAHHTSNGCNLRPGDLLGSGTISGVTDESRACLLELTMGGRSPIRLPNGEERTFLEDGDEVIFRACCEAPGRMRIGFGECRGTIEGRP